MIGLSRAQETTETNILSLGMSDRHAAAISRHAVPLVCALGVYSSPGQSVATMGREMVLVPVSVDRG